MRINGRTLRPSTLAERRFLLSLGIAFLHVPRSQNPYSVARRIRRAAKESSPDAVFVRELVQGNRKKAERPIPSPELDTPDTDTPDPEAVHGQAA